MKTQIYILVYMVIIGKEDITDYDLHYNLISILFLTRQSSKALCF